MAIATDSRVPTSGRRKLSRYTLGGAILAIGLLVLAAVLILGGGTHKQQSKAVASTSGSTSTHASGNSAASRSSGAVGASGSSAGSGSAVAPGGGEHGGVNTKREGAARAHAGARTRARSTPSASKSTSVEVADPEAAKSFPAPASVHHKAASTPGKAAQLAVAPGAPSDAEIRHELAQMHSLQQAQQQAQQATAAGGGGSVGGNGTITPSAGVPAVIARVVAGGNAIADFPYVFGGGHASFVDNAYDCSGSVSYALAAGGLISAPETSGSLESWGDAGPGKWITVFANAGHTYMYVNTGGAWMRFDTSGRSGVFGSRWQPGSRSNAGFVARHPPGL